MSQPYVGECRLVAFNFAPAGWLMCAGSLLPISEYDTLFNLIGTTYGGDGQTTFGLPDLRGRTPIHQGSGFTIAQSGGQETVTLTTPQMPAHTHPLLASGSGGNTNNLQGKVLAVSPSPVYVANTPPTKPMNSNSVTSAGGNQSHDNLQPFLVMNWVISLFGVYPSQS
ncbi:MAG: tail fiber protein [Bryobacteraceae bacterium]|jgi:microcystin-dependent protein